MTALAATRCGSDFESGVNQHVLHFSVAEVIAVSIAPGLCRVRCQEEDRRRHRQRADRLFEILLFHEFASVTICFYLLNVFRIKKLLFTWGRYAAAAAVALARSDGWLMLR